MITYELAKKLKDAGFPNSGNWVSADIASQGKRMVIGDQSEIYIVPTLSELIEACGDKFEWLGKYSAMPYGYIKDPYFNKIKWVCGKWNSDIAYEGDYFDEMSHGDTSEEAVANLWLELNKIDNT